MSTAFDRVRANVVEYDNFTNELVVSGRDMEYNAVCGHDARGDITRESFFKAFFKSFKAGLTDGTVGRTYFTGVLPITLDDLSSGFNVGTVVNLNEDMLGLAGFTQAQVEKYVDEIYAEYGFDRSNIADVLADLKAFYDGYRFLPDAEPLYNSTICNWYLFNFVSCKGKQPADVIDSNVRTDIGWFRRFAQTPQNALSKVRGYVERGEGEDVVRTTFTSRCLDALTVFYSFETEYNSSEGRCDFLAIPKPGFGNKKGIEVRAVDAKNLHLFDK